MPRNLWDDGYGTHLPSLIYALQLVPEGPVLEMGAGYWSTPVLHQLCAERLLVTWEPTRRWREQFESMTEGQRRPAQEHHFISDETLDGLQAVSWAVVLVDGPLPSRVPALSLTSQLFVVHDTEPNHAVVYPGLHERLAQFKYRRDDKELYPWTTLVSNSLEIPEV